MKKLRSIILRVLFGIPMVLILLFAFLQSPPGKALLADGISKALGASGTVSVEIGKISGFIPARIKLESLVLSDRDGIWLEAKNLRFRWAMRDLFDGLVNVKELGAASINFIRFPKAGEEEPPIQGHGSFEPVEVALGNLHIQHLRLGEAVAGIPLEYAVYSGGIRLHADGSFSGSLDVSGDADGRIEVSMPPLGTADYVLKAKAELSALRTPDLGLQGLTGLAEATISKESTSVLLSAGADGIDLGIDARIVVGAGAWKVDFQRLEVKYRDSIGFAVRGSIGNERVDLSGDIAEFDIGQLPLAETSNFTGRVGGHISVVGPLATPHAVATLDVLDLTTTQVALDELPDLNLHIDFKLSDGVLNASSCITNAVSGSMAATAEMPCAFSIQPVLFKPELDRLKLTFNADADLGILNGLAIFDNERIAGRLDAGLVFDGHSAEKLTGHIVITGGTYEHYEWGVLVRDVEADLEAGRDGLVVKRMTATDGNAGRVTVKGGIEIWNPGIPLALQVDFDKASLVRRDEMDAILSGAISIAGLLSKPAVGGRLVIDRAEIQLDNIARPTPRLLVNYNAGEATDKNTVNAASKELPFTIDVDVSMPDQIYVNASMIDSVWGGELKLRNAPGGVAVSGVIRPRRGYLSFIGKKFRLMDDGRIDLDGSIPPVPSLNISAEYSRSDIVARLTLTGKLNNPRYSLTSTPALPEDEVLSQVLFGRDTAAISPYQAFQIASAARQLSGEVRGPGFMYQMRQALSIDTLEWREPDTPDGTSSVAAGKYVTSGLYVEVNSTLDSKENGTGMTAEYELTRHFSVETSTGPQMRPGIGVNWKVDY